MPISPRGRRPAVSGSQRTVVRPPPSAIQQLDAAALRRAMDSGFPGSFRDDAEQEDNDNHSVDDLNRRYNGCYFRAFIEGVPRILLIRDIYGSRTSPQINGSIVSADAGSNGSHYEGAMSDIVVDFSFPSLGIINTRSYGALCVDKLVERQWRRGLNSRIVTIHSYNHANPSLDSEIACSILRNTYVGVRDAVDKLVRGDGRSFGISNDIAFVVNSNRSNISVYYNTDEVGHFCLMTGDIVLLRPFEPLLEYITSKNIGVVRVGEI